MAKAKYMVFIPSAAKQVSVAAHHYLMNGPLATAQATVHHGTPFDTLLVFAEDTPEIDSHMKQLGVFAGEIANAPTITVTKEGPKATAVWDMRNPYFQPQPPAPSAALGAGPLPQSGSPLPYSQPGLGSPGIV